MEGVVEASPSGFEHGTLWVGGVGHPHPETILRPGSSVSEGGAGGRLDGRGSLIVAQRKRTPRYFVF